MSTLFAPRWRTRPAPVDFGYAPETNPENPNMPPAPPYSGFSGDFPGSEPNLPAAPDTPTTVVCYTCRASDFWPGSGAVVCRRCHPPAPGAECRTSKKAGARTADPVQIDAGSAAVTTSTRTDGVRPRGARR